MNWLKIFGIVTAGALFGMVMGGLFGFGAGALAPKFFAHLIPWNDIEPKGFATVFGATVGVLLGGGLATFGLIFQAFSNRNK